MKILKKVLIALLVLIAIPFILALFINGKYAVEREVSINQPKAVVFDYVKYLRNQDSFSVWAKKDPNMKKGIEGEDGTVGAFSSWDSEDEEVGKGEQEIIKIIEGERIDFELRFKKPFEATDYAYFVVESLPENQTKVKWGFDGEMKYPMNLMLLFMDMEEMLAPSLQEGLDNLKIVLEDMKTKPAIEITEEIVESKPILFIKESSSIMPNEISTKMGAAYGELMALIGIAKLEMAAAPIAITTKYAMEEMICEFNPAIPVVAIPEELELSGRIEKGESYAGKVLKTVHTGNYMNLKATYDAMLKYIEDKGYEINGHSWEEYIDNPEEVAEENRRTNIYFPVK
ncbi:MAG: GyrI-like domain-containing protein [Vicingus serpentipes]|nr:GyrI-like domain-containing protein [Vicingus serpentipes]